MVVFSSVCSVSWRDKINISTWHFRRRLIQRLSGLIKNETLSLSHQNAEHLIRTLMPISVKRVRRKQFDSFRLTTMRPDNSVAVVSNRADRVMCVCMWNWRGMYWANTNQQCRSQLRRTATQHLFKSTWTHTHTQFAAFLAMNSCVESFGDWGWWVVMFVCFLFTENSNSWIA